MTKLGGALSIAMASLLCLPLAKAAPAPQTSTASVAKAEDEKGFSGAVQVQRNNSLYLKQGETPVASWDFTGALNYKFSSLWTIQEKLAGSQDLKNPETSDIAKSVLKFIYNGISASEDKVLFVPSLSFGMPVSREQNTASFQGSAGLSLKATANPDYLFSKKLGVEATIGGSRNFHKYDTTAAGKVNTMYGSTQSLILAWNFTDALSLSVEFDHYDLWSYQGALTELFGHVEELGYMINKSWAVAVGHQYGNPYASVWKTDGSTYNFNTVDEDNSIIYGAITYTF